MSFGNPDSDYHYEQFLENSDYFGRSLPPYQSLAQSPRRGRFEYDFDSFFVDRDSVFVDEKALIICFLYSR